MKTVWHWKNIGKAFGMVVLAGVVVSLLQLPPMIGHLAGMAAGGGAMIFSMLKWDLWSFK